MNTGKIAIVDDSPDTKEILKVILAGGDDIQTYMGGPQFLESHSPGLFELVILDISMPGMNGYELLSKIRDRGDLVPVVALSAMAYDTDRECALQAGFADYITKPILDLEEFKRQVYRHRREQ